MGESPYRQMVKVVFIGAGRLAFNLATAMYQSNGFDICQVFSRTEKSAKELADAIEACYTCHSEEIVSDADLYIVAVNDVALLPLITSLPRSKGIWVHTAGSMDMDLFAPYRERFGVFYPFQTFSKGHKVDFSALPIYIEGSTSETEQYLYDIASQLSSNVIRATSVQRRKLHLAAVFACNFSNCCYAIAAELLEAEGLSFDGLLPLIDETARKVHSVRPREAQTGPAVRNDTEVMAYHIEQLPNEELKAIYRMMSARIRSETPSDQ